MKREPHHNKKWFTPTEAARYTGHNRISFRRWASAGQIRCKANPFRKGQDGWLYNREDIDKFILRII